jgi:hypothetical protein
MPAPAEDNFPTLIFRNIPNSDQFVRGIARMYANMASGQQSQQSALARSL